MRFYMAERWDDSTTRYQAMQANPDCFAFYKADHVWACFYDRAALKLWRNQK